jgi:hypothetical protein
MWNKILKYLPLFSSAVLTGFDSQGNPFSVRCHPLPDEMRKIIRVQIPPGVGVRPGPACLLFHQHDQRLWNLKSFVVRGRLQNDDAEWYFTPLLFIPGMGIEGIRSYIGFILNGRKKTREFLERRNLERPKIPWDELESLLNWARKEG